MKTDKSISVTSMPFSVTLKKDTVAIVNKDSLAMVSFAHAKKQKQFMLRPCCPSMMHLLFLIKSSDLCVLLVHNMTIYYDAADGNHF